MPRPSDELSKPGLAVSVAVNVIGSVNFQHQDEQNPHRAGDREENDSHERKHVAGEVRQRAGDEASGGLRLQRAHQHDRRGERQQEPKDLEHRERAKGERHEKLRRNCVAFVQRINRARHSRRVVRCRHSLFITATKKHNKQNAAGFV